MDFVGNPLDDRISELQDKEIEKSVNMINSTHKSVQLEGLAVMRLLLTLHINTPIQKIIDSGIVPKILEILASESETQFLIESSWCLLHICSTEEEKPTQYIVELGGLDIILNLFGSNVEEVVRHAVWTMCNIAGTGSKYRDICLERDYIPKLLQILERFPTSQDIIDQALRGIANLCHGKPSPKWDQVFPALPVLHKHISQVISQEALSYALRALTYITTSEENCQKVIDQGFVPHLIVHLCAGSQEISFQVLRILGHFIAGDDDEQMNAVLIFPEFLPKLFELTKNDRELIRREAFWMISNIAGGLSTQMNEILENDDFMLRLKTAVSTEPQTVANEVAYAIVNMFRRANPEQIRCLVEKHGLLESLTHITTNFDDMKQDVFEVAVGVLETENSDSETDYKKYVKEAGLIEIIVDLANDDELRSNANLILEYLRET